jgi:AcrR family transcriptional regulator
MRADARRNRERVFQVAREMFSEDPHSAGMDEIARRAGVGIGTLYRNFPSRIDLIEAIYREDLAALATLADRLIETRNPWDALAEWLLGFARFTESKRAILGELGQAFEANPDLAAQARHQIDSAALKVLTRAHAAGAVRPDVTAPDLIQLVGGFVLFIAADPERTDHLLGVVLDGLRT